jgi:pimeloyl-ACP methyl ester carboxylesterase
MRFLYTLTRYTMSKPKSKHTHRHPPASRPAEPPEVVDPRWILTALGSVLGFAILCAYITTCVLFYRSQWQLALTPSRTVAATPALPLTAVRFGTDASGQPQLTGWWVPSGVSGARTALVLHAGTGSLSNMLPTADLLHAAGLNTLVFDYRGFGQSGGQHPNQQLMQEDAAAALRYLTDTRHIPLSQIVVFGQGVGAALAAELCAQHPEIRDLIVEDAKGDVDRQLSSDPRASLVPAHRLFNQKFALAQPLRSLATPKLLITHTPGGAPQFIQNAADPKVTVELPVQADPKLEVEAIRRFLSDKN